ADAPRGVAPELDRVDEFAGRFPGWAEALALAHRRIAALERTIETLSDRLAHDPHLAAAMHEVLSTATAIRSTAAILAETGEIEPEWRDRFHRNLNEDSRRLAESSRALVAYLGETEAREDGRAAPQDEVETFLSAHGHHFAGLEDGTSDPGALVRAAPGLTTDAARDLARRVLTQYASDARSMPMGQMREGLARHGLDVPTLVAELRQPWQAVFRRLAAMPQDVVGAPVGLVICDASGSLLFRKPVAGFTLPRFGEGCPLWPLFSALARPLSPIRRRVEQVGRLSAQFDCFAIAHPLTAPGIDRDPVYLSTMLMLPAARAQADAQPVGATCRVCLRAGCEARREPSVLIEGF
ncbi:MAG: transcriptional regulator, partial [Rhodobacteraceae bacterium]